RRRPSRRSLARLSSNGIGGGFVVGWLAALQLRRARVIGGARRWRRRPLGARLRGCVFPGIRYAIFGFCTASRSGFLPVDVDRIEKTTRFFGSFDGKLITGSEFRRLYLFAILHVLGLSGDFEFEYPVVAQFQGDR